MKQNPYVLVGIFCVLLVLIGVHYIYGKVQLREGMSTYIQEFKDPKHRMFPFRYFTDDKGNVVPVVAVTGFFREKKAEERYHEYVSKGIKIIGITAYKSFPNREMLDESEGEYERNDTFQYTEHIKHWLCCLKNPERYGFTSQNTLMDMSESDFYTSEDDRKTPTKKYDFIYICCKDSDTCPLNGWNAVNRNFDLALKCFPILCGEWNMKGLVVGRVGCGLEKKYGDKMEVVEWLDWHILQEKMRESRMLFVPNIYDASPRVVAECITKDVPVIMNENILCGSKYINYETGELFSDENTLRTAVSNLLQKRYKISPKKWWNENYSQEKSQKKLRDFLFERFPEHFLEIDRVKFIL
jgi:hypothetical protein